MDVLLIGVAIQVLCGAAAFALSRSPRAATLAGAGGAVVGCLLGLPPALRVLSGGAPESLDFAWDAAHGAFRVGVDGLGAFVLLWHGQLAARGTPAGGLDFEAFRSAPPAAGWAAAVFVLALVGFGAKAGFVPFHVWLPEAHPAAPSHVSALMSGVMIKMGVYGILRVMTFLGEPAAWWGPTLIVIGLAGGLIGISLAFYQRDLKRALAYSSIENVG